VRSQAVGDSESDPARAEIESVPVAEFIVESDQALDSPEVATSTSVTLKQSFDGSFLATTFLSEAALNLILLTGPAVSVTLRSVSLIANLLLRGCGDFTSICSSSALSERAR